MATIAGYVTALVVRDPGHTAAASVAEAYSPSRPPGQRTRQFQLEPPCKPRRLAMISVLRDALVHHVPIRETCSEGPAEQSAGRIPQGVQRCKLRQADRQSEVILLTLIRHPQRRPIAW